MLFHRPLLFALALVALIGACGPTTDSEAEPSGEPAAEEGVSSAEASVDISCRLMGDATLEEAAERLSPLGQTDITLESHVGRICYGRPSAKGRVVEGGLIPFDQPWRVGANEATAIHLPFPARVGGIDLQPGSYSLYAQAGEFEWEFFLNSNAERWGIPIDEGVTAQNIGSFTGLPRTLTEPVEQFTINWHTHGGDNGHLVLEWGSTRVEIEVGLLEHAH
jgi:hypothetical protein